MGSILIIVDQFRRWIHMEPMIDNSSEAAIDALVRWTGGGRTLASLEMIEYVRSDAGTQLKSQGF